MQKKGVVNFLWHVVGPLKMIAIISQVQLCVKKTEIVIFNKSWKIKSCKWKIWIG